MSLSNPPKAEEPQTNPFAPPLPEPQIMEQFAGVNTSTTRAGVPDAMCSWIDGFMPVAPRNLRTLPGVGPQLRGAFSSTIVFFGFYNLGATPYALYFLSDGSVQSVNTSGTPITTQILPPSTIISPSITGVGFAQWGQQYLLIVANQTNGYWIWDGTNLYEPGSLSPIITLTDPGSGYQTVPSVTASGGSGVGAVFAAQIANGVVTGVSIVNPGTGYLAGQTVSLIFTGGQVAGSGASLTALMSHASGSNATIALTFDNFTSTFWTCTSASVVSHGAGYSPFATAQVNQAPAGTAAADLTLTITSGSISAVTLGGYTTSGLPGFGSYNGEPPLSALITDNGDYYVSSVSIVNHGTGYSGTASITSTGGGATIATPASFSPVIVGGSISSVLITNPGQYGSNVAPTLAVTDSLSSAEGTISLMPFGISGTTIETYQGRAWIANGPTIYFGAPGSFTDFATSDGGGNFTSGDNFLRVSYVRLVNTNGFLYLIADSSMNYISGVTTSGVPPTTTFTNQNADPEIGTPYPASVLCRGRDIVLANSVGVHISRGAALDKVSEALDGVWDSVPSFGSLTQLSAAKATVFSKRIWMVLAQIVDPVAGTTQNKLLVWNGKEWYATVQDFGPLTFIATQEINSVLTAWGTDGTVIKPLFQTPSISFQKTVQSRYWDAPGGYQFSKASSRFWSVWDYNVTGSLNMVVSIDAVGIKGTDGTTFTGSATYTIPSPSGTGYFVTPPEAVGQQGVLTGMTIQTNEADVSLVSAMLQNDPRISYRG